MCLLKYCITAPSDIQILLLHVLQFVSIIIYIFQNFDQGGRVVRRC